MQRPALRFLKRFFLPRTFMLVLLQGQTPEGEPFYAYIALQASRLGKLRRAMQSAHFDIREHGKVLAHGTGEPDDSTKQLMQETYGFSHDSALILST